MAIEIVIFVKVLSKSFLKKMILDFKKSDLTISEMYFQQGYNDKNEPLETEERGLNKDEIIAQNLRSLTGSVVQGVPKKSTKKVPPENANFEKIMPIDLSKKKSAKKNTKKKGKESDLPKKDDSARESKPQNSD